MCLGWYTLGCYSDTSLFCIYGLMTQDVTWHGHAQEVFPRSYAETAEWLRRERTAYHDTLARCTEELKTSLDTDPQLTSLAVTCQVSF